MKARRLACAALNGFTCNHFFGPRGNFGSETAVCCLETTVSSFRFSSQSRPSTFGLGLSKILDRKNAPDSDIDDIAKIARKRTKAMQCSSGIAS